MTLKTANREVRLQWFARRIIDSVWTGQIDEDDIIMSALSAGLLVEQEATDDDVEKYDLDIEPGETFAKFSDDLDAVNVDWHQLGEESRTLSKDQGE